jgi:hypothetical protein
MVGMVSSHRCNMGSNFKTSIYFAIHLRYDTQNLYLFLKYNLLKKHP